MLKNSIRFFGASLDALDTMEAIRIKRWNIENKQHKHRNHPIHDIRDPYDLFKKLMGSRIYEYGHENLGRFMVDSWLTPRPEASEMDLVQMESYFEFLMNNGCRVFAELLKDFVKFHVFPHIPGMIGVDHSLTGGVLMALSEHLGPENLGILVFDVHTDAIPLPIRSGLVHYSAGNGPGPILESAAFDPYSTGSFLFQLIKNEIILPVNLIIVGPGDSPEKLRNLNDKRVMEYVCHYDSLLERGVKIVTKDQLQQFGPAAIHKDLDQLKCPNLYISLDVDVSAHCGVLASRFVDLVGTDTSLILEGVFNVGELFCSKRFSLVGLDIMEIDIHKIGAKLRSGMEDRTGHFIQQFISMLISSIN
jgi:arginase family enzyme